MIKLNRDKEIPKGLLYPYCDSFVALMDFFSILVIEKKENKCRKKKSQSYN
jgi:hypothetical protein